MKWEGKKEKDGVNHHQLKRYAIRDAVRKQISSVDNQRKITESKVIETWKFKE